MAAALNELPTATVASTWREAVGPQPLEELRDRLLAAVDAEHHQRDYRAVTVGELDACSIDGSLTRAPDTSESSNTRSASPGRAPSNCSA